MKQDDSGVNECVATYNACIVIAHYNYMRSCGLSREAGPCPDLVSPTAWNDPLHTSAHGLSVPKNPEQEISCKRAQSQVPKGLELCRVQPR